MEETRGTDPPKAVITDIGPVDIDVPRDRDGTSPSMIVRKHHRRLAVDDVLLSLELERFDDW